EEKGTPTEGAQRILVSQIEYSEAVDQKQTPISLCERCQKPFEPRSGGGSKQNSAQIPAVSSTIKPAVTLVTLMTLRIQSHPGRSPARAPTTSSTILNGMMSTLCCRSSGERAYTGILRMP